MTDDELDEMIEHRLRNKKSRTAMENPPSNLAGQFITGLGAVIEGALTGQSGSALAAPRLKNLEDRELNRRKLEALNGQDELQELVKLSQIRAKGRDQSFEMDKMREGKQIDFNNDMQMLPFKMKLESDKQLSILAAQGANAQQLERMKQSHDSAIKQMQQNVEVWKAQLSADTTRRGQDVSSNTTMRGQDVSAATARLGQSTTAETARRGQDISATTARRGQDITSTTARRGQDKQITAKATKAAGPKQLPSDKVLLVNEGNSIPTLLEDIKQTISQNADLFGPIQGRLAALNPYDERATAIKSQVKAASQAFGRFMEGGVLRKEDESKYLQMFPNNSDTPESAANKLRIVERLLIQKQTSNLDALAKSGYDTSGLTGKIGAAPDVPKVLRPNAQSKPQFMNAGGKRYQLQPNGKYKEVP